MKNGDNGVQGTQITIRVGEIKKKKKKKGKKKKEEKVAQEKEVEGEEEERRRKNLAVPLASRPLDDPILSVTLPSINVSPLFLYFRWHRNVA